MAETEIRIENARSHNLKGVSCRIPLRALCVITGVSGSGKSTLAFDTLYAEGQRRYVTSLSTYARQFLERFPRPQVDSISSLPPAIAIEQRNRVSNARSTVGSATEILDHLRLLFARAGRTRCPDCDEWVAPGGVSAVASRIVERFAGQRIHVTAPLVRAPEEEATVFRDRLSRDGFVRVLDEAGAVHDLVETAEAELEPLLGRARLLIDRMALSASADDEQERRVAEAAASAFARGHGRLEVRPQGGEPALYLEGFSCDGCGRAFSAPEPSLFSFNSPLGACPSCQGFGRTAEVDWDRVVSEPERSLEEHAIAPFATPMGRSLERDLLRACRQAGVPTDVPFAALDEAQQRWVFEGDEDEWYGVQGFFDWLEGRRYKVQSRVLIARYRRFVTCLDCGGTRLCADARAVKVDGRDIGELARMTIAELELWLQSLTLPEAAEARAGRVVELLQTRLATAQAVGLGYLGLDRQVRTLSGGEAQRIQLATALGGGLTASLYVLDEPSVGLHPRDMDQLLDVLLAIRDQGNTVVVVEHASEILAAADHVIDLGPGAGRLGGQLLVEGDLEAVRGCAQSRTGELLRGELGAGRAPQRRPVPSAPGRRLRVLGASEHNLQNVDVDIPLDRLVVVTGVSGAGKSSLVQSVLVDQLLPQKDRRGPPGACEAIEGRELIRQIVVVDQTPAVRSPRSNPATVSKAFDGIRQRFAGTREARARGFAPGWFSFNVAGGRCDTCEGAGEVVIDMQFLDDLRVPCDACGGLRYRREVLEVRIEGRSIVDVLAMTIDEAADFFAGEARIVDRLAPLRRVGLGYLTLGQPLSTLSGGENQRIRLANALGGAAPGVLYVLDEPTTGLHAADVEVLLGCLDELVDGGASVLVIEHNLDVISRADWLIDLGPEGGPGGGQIVAQGTPQDVESVPESHTGRALERAPNRIGHG
jgi:excinuclease ABC subunit A